MNGYIPSTLHDILLLWNGSEFEIVHVYNLEEKTVGHESLENQIVQKNKRKYGESDQQEKLNIGEESEKK